jgi:hypothetical protein
MPQGSDERSTRHVVDTETAPPAMRPPMNGRDAAGSSRSTRRVAAASRAVQEHPAVARHRPALHEQRAGRAWSTLLLEFIERCGSPIIRLSGPTMRDLLR